MATSIGGDTAVAERSGAKEIKFGVSFEDLYTSEFEAVLGLAYALSGKPVDGPRISRKKRSSRRTVAGTG